MRTSKWIREVHRWLSLGFTAGVIANLVAMQRGTPPAWVGMLALFPLVLLSLTGLYLFALPYLARGRAERRTVES